jgi:release factor glutamine methyltransferase
MKVARALDEAVSRLSRARIDEPRLEAEILLARLLDRERLWLYVHRDADLDDATIIPFKTLIERKARNEPTAYIVGQREFWSLSFVVSPDTLIPRPETEMLVEIGLELAKKERWTRPHILDLGTGSGVLAVCLACEIKDALIVAVERSQEALTVARENARRHRVESRIHFLRSDWLAALRPNRRTASAAARGDSSASATGFDLVVANPPYVARRAQHLLPKEVLNFEPEEALFSGADGMDAIRTITRQAPNVLRRRGWLVCEIGWDQGRRAEHVAKDTQKFEEVKIRKDLSGNDRVLVARTTSELT